MTTETTTYTVRRQAPGAYLWADDCRRVPLALAQERYRELRQTRPDLNLRIVRTTTITEVVEEYEARERER